MICLTIQLKPFHVEHWIFLIQDVREEEDFAIHCIIKRFQCRIKHLLVTSYIPETSDALKNDSNLKMYMLQ